ncbi:hypothetical protein ACS8FD_14620, partial [Psychrobacter sp. 1U2]
ATQIMIMSADAELETLNDTLTRLEQDGIAKLKEDGFSDEDIEIERAMEMRYVGQVHECNVIVPNGNIDSNAAEDILQAFHKRHKELYTYDERDSAVELVNVEVSIIGKVNKPELPTLDTQVGSVESAKVDERKMIHDHTYQWMQTPIYDGNKLGAGAVVTGPALIEEPTTTIVVKPNWQADLHQSGTYKLSKIQ